MEQDQLRVLLEQVKTGGLDIEDAMQSLRNLPFEDLDFARIDHHRALRTGTPEVVYCPGKTTDQIIIILQRLKLQAHKALATRATPEVAAQVIKEIPEAKYHDMARILVVPGLQSPAVQDPKAVGSPIGTVLVLAAGTADLPVAEEAVVTATELGSPVERLYDVGVAGIHRLLSQKEKLFAANVLIVVAGMEGALASVVGGLVARPVIAVPTSVGYGASFGGVAALLTMLNSCATGIGVMNIDNGFGAGFLAHRINQRCA